MAGQGRGLPTRRRRRSRIFYCLLPARAPSFLQRVRRPASRPSPGEAARARSEPSRRERAETEKTRRGGRRRTTITKRTTPKHKKKSLRFSLLCTAAAAGPPPPPGNHTSPLNYYSAARPSTRRPRCPMASLNVSSRSMGRTPFAARETVGLWTEIRIRLRVRGTRRATLSSFPCDRCRASEDGEE